MSADAWRVCPKCKKDAEEEYLVLFNEAHGVVKLTDTLREDFEVWTDEDGIFEVSYDASCNVCGFKFAFNHSEQVKL